MSEHEKQLRCHCGYTSRKHCSFDEPGVDHAYATACPCPPPLVKKEADWKYRQMNYPDEMTRSDVIHVGEIEPDFVGETKVLRAVVYLTYDQSEIQYPEEDIEECQSPFDAEQDIGKALGQTGSHSLIHAPSDIEVVDAEYMSLEAVTHGG